MNRSLRTPSLAAVLAALLAAAAPALARPLAPDAALLAASAWRARDARPLGRRTGAPTGRTRTFSENGTNLFHLVELSGGGFVAVAADDSRPPVMAFSPSGELPEEDDGGPLWALLAADGAAAGGLPPRRRAHRGRLSAEERRFAPPAMRRNAAGDAGDGVSSVSDVRVAPLVESRWNQLRVGSKNVYNYYTPKNWYCGCVATAMAQLMRYHRFPRGAVAVQTFNCSSNGVPTALSTIGGVYDWDAMPLVPASSTITDAQREMIGRLCYDAGVSVRMQYSPGGSGAFGAFALEPLTQVFGYACAQGYIDADSIPEPAIRNAILANLDAGCPVMLGILAPGSSGQDAGHSILADGYGFEDGMLWCHLNMGWSGSCDLWYALPFINAQGYAFTLVQEVVYNVFPDGTGELVTGRVTSPSGRPLAGAEVTATYTTGNWPRTQTVTTNVTTSATGVYAVRIPAPTRNSRSVSLSATWRGFASTNAASASIKSSASPYDIDWETGSYHYASGGLSIGNSWGNDLAIPLPPPTVYSVR